MNPMRYILAILASAICLHADSIDIGGKLIEVPSPAGFVRVTPDMTEVKRLSDQMIDPVNDTLAFYIPEAAVPAAMSGEIPDLGRYFMLKVNKKLKAYTASVAEFADLQNTVASQNIKLFEQIKEKMPDYFDKINGNLKKEYGSDFSLGVFQMLPLDPHHKSENAFSYSMFMNVGSGTGPKQSMSVIPATATFLNTSGRILFLYSYGTKDDLAWTRDASQAWHTAILSRNLPPPKKASKAGFDWGQVAEKAISGAIIGGVVALIGVIISKKKKKEG
jgi:hypothetical protein